MRIPFPPNANVLGADAPASGSGSGSRSGSGSGSGLQSVRVNILLSIFLHLTNVPQSISLHPTKVPRSTFSRLMKVLQSTFPHLMKAHRSIFSRLMKIPLSIFSRLMKVLRSVFPHPTKAPRSTFFRLMKVLRSIFPHLTKAPRSVLLNELLLSRFSQTWSASARFFASLSHCFLSLSFLSSPSAPPYPSSLCVSSPHARLHSPLSHPQSRHRPFPRAICQLDAPNTHPLHHRPGSSRDRARPGRRSRHARGIAALARNMNHVPVVGRHDCTLLQQQRRGKSFD